RECRAHAAAARDQRCGRDGGDEQARPRLPQDRGDACRPYKGSGRMSANGIRHFLDLAELPGKELRKIIDLAREMKKRGDGARVRPLDGATLAMIFDKPSTRTRVSFDV